MIHCWQWVMGSTNLGCLIRTCILWDELKYLQYLEESERKFPIYAYVQDPEFYLCLCTYFYLIWTKIRGTKIIYQCFNPFVLITQNSTDLLTVFLTVLKKYESSIKISAFVEGCACPARWHPIVAPFGGGKAVFACGRKDRRREFPPKSPL